MSVRLTSFQNPRKSTADGLSENVLAAILESNTTTTNPGVSQSPKNETILSNSTELDCANGGKRVDTSIDNSSSGLGSKRSLHSSRQTLVDSKEFYTQYGLKWLRAIRHDDMSTIRRLLDEKPELANYAPLYAPNSIHLAVARGNRNLVALLITKGADIEARDAAGYTSLQNAVLLGDWTMTNFLIKEESGQ